MKENNTTCFTVPTQQEIYVSWDRQLIFKSFEEAFKYFMGNENDCEFNDFLNEHYSAAEVFDFDAADKRRAQSDYEDCAEAACRDWLSETCSTIVIESAYAKFSVID